MTTRRACLLAAALLATGAARAQAAPPAEVAAELAGARLQGGGRLRYFGLRVYDARLWLGAAALGADWAAVPFALELDYARSLKGALIAERSITEMRRQGEIAPAAAQRWLEQMKQLFPDVGDGDRLTGINLPERGARFYFNGKLRGEVGDPDFARLFFGIWLAPVTSEPALRESLLGLRPS